MLGSPLRSTVVPPRTLRPVPRVPLAAGRKASGQTPKLQDPLTPSPALVWGWGPGRKVEAGSSRVLRVTPRPGQAGPFRETPGVLDGVLGCREGTAPDAEPAQ